MVNGASNRMVIATGTDAMEAVGDVTFDGIEFEVNAKTGARVNKLTIDDLYAGFLTSVPAQGRGNLDSLITSTGNNSTALGIPNVYFIISNSNISAGSYAVPGYGF